MICNRFQSEGMKLLDGEMTPEEKKAYEAHVKGCEDCSGELRDIGRIVEFSNEIELKEPDEEYWTSYWDDIFRRLERGTGFVMLIAGLLGVTLLGLYKAVTSPEFLSPVAGAGRHFSVRSQRAISREQDRSIQGSRAMIVATTDRLEGKRITRVLGLVKGSTIRARHIGKDLTAAFKNITGGEVREYTKLMAESREQCLDRMREQATKMGANAVVGVRFMTSSVMQSAAELLVYGTAVIVEDE
jgi:uncharacterized protein YbjQ (UPF0145 family)